MTEARLLYETVIKNGYCIGCGACTCPDHSPFTVGMNDHGALVAEVVLEESDAYPFPLLAFCPFSDGAKNEDELTDLFFPGINARTDQVGKYISCYAGYVNEGDFRARGSSGGIAKWLGYALLKKKEIDYFVQVSENSTGRPGALLFDYKIFDRPEDVIHGSTSAYYPTTLAHIIGEMSRREGRYAVTGVPCNIKALRLTALHNDTIRKRLKYTIGIVCGGMKSANYAKLIGWELGVHPDDLMRIEFRRKHENRPANEKIYQVWSSDQETRFGDVSQIYGTGYAAGFFKPLACDYCDDVFAETADISIGDAWLKKYVLDPKGTSLLVVRNQALLDLLRNEIEEGHISLNPLSSEEAELAQKGGLRHRREALSRRLANKIASGEWVPRKRIKAGQYKICKNRQRIYDIRENIAIKSHAAFRNALAKNNLKIFHKEMNPLIIRFAVSNFRELFPKIPRRVCVFVSNKIKKTFHLKK